MNRKNRSDRVRVKTSWDEKQNTYMTCDVQVGDRLIWTASKTEGMVPKEVKVIREFPRYILLTDGKITTCVHKGAILCNQERFKHVG